MKVFSQKIANVKKNSSLKLKKTIDYIFGNARKLSLDSQIFSSEKNPFTEINIFKSENSQLRLCFFFFFAVAICGYLSVMILSVPYRDDWYRYFWNSHVGGSEALRSGTALIEYLFYLSNVNTDAAPFTQILSCAVLAYTACIFLRILKIDIRNKWEMLCLIPVVVNPFLLEIMLYRFDNFFITSSLLMVSVSAYLSLMNRKDCFIIQTLLLFLSLFVYQVAISAYLTIFVYEFMKKIRSGKKFVEIIRQMRHWFYSLIASALVYVPMLQHLNYCKSEDGSVLAVPYNFENIQIVANNIGRYFYTLYNDWSHCVIGLIFLIMIGIFVIKNLIGTEKTTKSAKSVFFVFFCLFVLMICPSGLYACLKAFRETELLTPRLLCGAGAFIAIVYHEVYLLLRKVKLTDFLMKIVLCLTATWNLMFLNSAINIMRENFKVRNLLEHDIAKDVFELSKTYPNISYFNVTGEIETQSLTNFFKLYPIMDRIFPEKFNIFTYYRLGFMHNGLKKELAKDGSVFFNKQKHHSKKLIKECLLYDFYILDDCILQVRLRKDKSHKDLEEISQFTIKFGKE